MTRKLARWAFPLVLSVCAWAQSTSSTVTGKISDPSGGTVPEASVSASNEETGLRRSAASGNEGNYVLPLLPPGRYRITVQKDGFRPVTRSGVVLQVDQVARIDFVLEVGAVAESVEVTADAPLLDQQTSSLGQVVTTARS